MSEKIAERITKVYAFNSKGFSFEILRIFQRTENTWEYYPIHKIIDAFGEEYEYPIGRKPYTVQVLKNVNFANQQI